MILVQLLALALPAIGAALPSVFVPRTSNSTLPGALACTELIVFLGANKVDAVPTSPQYIESQFSYWNAMQSNYYPTCVVYPTSAQDVSTALKYIKKNGARFAIKAGGHNPNTFFSSVDQGVLLDLSTMTERTYNSVTTLGTYQPGGTFGDVYTYFAQYGRTVVGARLAGVGTGLALGGGLSYLSSQYGMACDSFRELEVVIPNGDIVTASPTQNSDLFFACRGGGGNAYGVVTKYTVQTRPAGTFYSGNIIYAFDQVEPVQNAIRNFTVNNKDPKAAIIGTFENFGIPSGGEYLNLDQVALMFLVYDGPDPGHAFDAFTSLPYLLNTMSQKSYLETVNQPIPFTTEASRGNNIFRVAVHKADDASTSKHWDAWHQWCEDNKGSYELSSIDFQPIPKSLTDASNSQNGGNAMQMPDGPWMWLNFLITTPPGQPSYQYNAIQQSFRDMVNSVPNQAGLPLFINDGNFDQNVLHTFSTFSKLQAIKQKYDPDGFFAKYTGGWSFN